MHMTEKRGINCINIAQYGENNYTEYLLENELECCCIFFFFLNNSKDMMVSVLAFQQDY